LEQNSPSSAHISQKLSEKTGVPNSLDGLQNFQTLSGKLPIGDIVRSFPLPWSAYVRLLSVDNELARRFYEAENVGWAAPTEIKCHTLSLLVQRKGIPKKGHPCNVVPPGAGLPCAEGFIRRIGKLAPAGSDMPIL
jgi:hypothetical protein